MTQVKVLIGFVTNYLSVENEKKDRRIRWLVLFIFFQLLVNHSCTSDLDSHEVVVGISKERSLSGKMYSEWLSYQEIPVRFVNLFGIPFSDVSDSLMICDALVLTGGADIFPGLYGKMEDTVRCGSFDHYRDSLEGILFKNAVELKMPVLGICRGLQLINVMEGGSLIIDLPQDKRTGDLHRMGAEDWTTHSIGIVAESMLEQSTESLMYSVASNHHQGIDQLAESLKPVAFSEDSLIEAIEWIDSAGKGFLLAVQWHPEWVEHADPFSREISALFLQEATSYHQSRKKNLSGE